jgi:tRNA/tmRNA/rRNA uracil-C5-methylase (TrmA/RlmC/RlmD family)
VSRPTRSPRQRQARGESVVGQRHTVEVERIAHGGFCVGRVEGRAVFVRHALPGETVVVEITEGTEGDRFWRGDAVEVLTPSADRIEPLCQYAGPALCGGCDFQHVTLKAQRALKTTVVREQLTRLGKIDAADPLLTKLSVEHVSGESADINAGLRWRTRVTWVGLPGGLRGLHEHRSRNVVEIDDCLIAAASAFEPAPASGIVSHTVTTSIGSHDFMVAADGFWQVHPSAPRLLVDTVLDMLQPAEGEKALDLYAGVGLFAAFLADAVGERGKVVAIEGDESAVGHAKANLAGSKHASAVVGSVDKVLSTSYDEPFDLVVLDPPRDGAKKAVVDQIVDRAPRAVAYVACDPAALGRDVALFAEHGYKLSALRAFDLFPMTHHVECVALFTRRDVS